jgi:hypothetical protein
MRLAIFLLALGTLPARATVIVSEGFAYPAGNLAGANGGTGWNGAWLNSPLNVDAMGMPLDSHVVSPDSTYGTTHPGFVSIGNKFDGYGAQTPSLTGNPSHEVRAFRFVDLTRPEVQPLLDAGRLGKDGSSLWIGFVARLASGFSSGNGGIHLYDGLTPLDQDPVGGKLAHERVFMGDRASNTVWFLGRTCGGCPGATIDDTNVQVNGTLRFLVYRFDFLPGSETVRMWIDPPLTGTPTDASALVTQTAFLDFRFDTVEAHSANSGSTEVIELDEFRIATSFGELVDPSRAAPTASSNGPICVGGDLSLFASTVPGATYAWTGPSGFTSSLQNPVVAGATASAAGVYSVTATVGGVTSTEATVTVGLGADSASPLVAAPVAVAVLQSVCN